MNVLLALPGALFVGFSLGVFGSGGSILTVPILVYLLGQHEKVAIASSLAIVGFVAMLGSIPFIRDKLVDWRIVFLFGIPGVMGTWFGAMSSSWVTGTVQLLTFAVVMLLASLLMLEIIKLPKAPASADHAYYKIAGEGFVVGILTGFVGVGGGFLIVPALVLLGGLSMRQAVASSLIIITFKSLAGFIKYLDVLADQNLEVDWLVIAFFGVAGVIGSFGGNMIANLLPQAALKKGFGVFLVIMAAFIFATSVKF